MNLKKFRIITQGWKGYFFYNEEVEREAKRRAEICAGCEHAVPVDALGQILKDPDNPDIEGMECNECGCPLSSKLRATDEECPLKKW